MFTDKHSKLNIWFKYGIAGYQALPKSLNGTPSLRMVQSIIEEDMQTIPKNLATSMPQF